MTRKPWEAQITITDSDVRRLIGSQFPALDIASLRPFAEGWDNAVWLVNEEWAFRFPRVGGAVRFIEAEISVLPHLAPRVPLPIPMPQYVGRPDDGYPWPFYGHRLIPGRDLLESRLSEDARIVAGRQLGDFLRVLHGVPPDELGVDLVRRPERSDVGRGLDRYLERIDRVVEADLWSPTVRVRTLISEAAALGEDPEVVVGHGDLHVRHLLVGNDGHATGVIDWGEVSLVHASDDLHIAWSGFSGRARRALLGAYGDIPDEWSLRAQVFALFHSIGLTLYAHETGQAELVREAVRCIERATSV